MRNHTLIRLLIVTALLMFAMFAIPVVASAQYYDRDRYDRFDRRDVYDAIVQLDNSSARLQNDLTYGRSRRVLGFFWVTQTDTNAVADVRDFRRSIQDLRYTSEDGHDLINSRHEARMVLDRGVQLDRYLRLSTGSESVDSDLAEIRSNLHVIADAYDLSMPY